VTGASGARPLPTAWRPAGSVAGLAVSVSTVEHAGELSSRRRRALSDVVAELTGPAARSSSAPGLAMRVYGEGCLALGLTGTFDRAALARLRDLMSELPRLAPTELVIDLSLLHSCEQALARVLAQLRVQRLVAGARVELHSPPAELTTTLGDTPAEEFGVVDDAAPSLSGRPDLSWRPHFPGAAVTVPDEFRLDLDVEGVIGGEPPRNLCRVLRVRGDVDMDTADRLASAVGAELHRARQPVVLDVAGMTFCGAAGLAVIAEAVTRAAEHRVGFAVVGLPPRLIGLCTALWPAPHPDHYPDLESAFAAVGDGDGDGDPGLVSA